MEKTRYCLACEQKARQKNVTQPHTCGLFQEDKTDAEKEDNRKCKPAKSSPS